MTAATALTSAPALRVVPAGRRQRRHYFPPAYVAAETCRRWGVTFDAVAGPGTTRQIVAARRDLVRQLRAKTAMSYVEIGLYLGGRHHTTVSHLDRYDRADGR